MLANYPRLKRFLDILAFTIGLFCLISTFSGVTVADLSLRAASQQASR